MDIINQKKVSNFINSKKFDKALKLCQKAIKINSNDDIAHMLLGIIYHKSNRLELAKKSLVHANKLNNKSVAILNNLSLVNDALGDYKATMSNLKSGLKIEPANKTLLENLARTHYVYGNYYQAAFQYKSNRLLGVTSHDTDINIINSLHFSGEHAEALAEIEEAEEKLRSNEGNKFKAITELLSFDLLMLKLELLSRLGKIKEVKSLLELIEKLELDFSDKGLLAKFYAVLGDKVKIQNIFSGAKFNKNTAVTAVTNYCIYSDLTKEELKLIEQYLSINRLKSEEYYFLAMALTDQYKKHKDLEKNKYWLKMANEKMKNHILNKDHIHLLDKIMAAHKNRDIPYSNCQSEQPIFIVGMPRSGTTLLESMLSVHNDINAAGELTLFSNAFKKLCPQLGDATILEQEYRYFDELAKLTVEDLDKVAAEYLKKSRAYVKPGAKYIVDKLPHNFINVGLIQKVFPKAKIIYIKRNPISVCFSIYEQHFHLFHDYRFDLEYLADYFLKFRELMSFWLDTAPKGTIYELDYERLVKDPDVEVTQLFDYLGLTKPEDVLEFHNKESIVHTASLEQVRQPIYVKKQEAWELMGDLVQPLTAKLGHLV